MTPHFFPNIKSVFIIYSPLIFTLFYFVGPIHDPRGLLNIVIVIAVYILQVGLYHVMATAESQRLTLIVMVLSITVSVASTSTNQTAYAFYWFIAYFAALKFSLSQAVLILLLILCGVYAGGVLFDFNHSWYYLPIFIPTAGLFAYGVYDRLEKTHARIQQKSEEEIQQLAKVAERERIARDLHDVMGHSLTTIALKSQLADKLAKAGKTRESLDEIAEVASLSRDSLNQMREVVSGYKLKSLSHHIEEMVHSLEKWQFNVKHDIYLPELNVKEESTLCLVLTEAITNIIKHSQANDVHIYSENKPTQYPSTRWALHIQDNGGIDHLNVGNGLLGMRERIEAIEGILHVSTDGGVHIAIYLRSKNTKEST